MELYKQSALLFTFPSSQVPTYSLVKVDGVLACDNISDRGSGGLAGGLLGLGRHF